MREFYWMLITEREYLSYDVIPLLLRREEAVTEPISGTDRGCVAGKPRVCGENDTRAAERSVGKVLLIAYSARNVFSEALSVLSSSGREVSIKWSPLKVCILVPSTLV